jgi:hypothetical protein
MRISDDRGARVTASGLTIKPTDPDNLVPLASLMAANVSGERPLTVDFDASASLDTDGIVVAYRWDFDGDGATDLETIEPEVSHTYYLKNEFEAAVRALDNDNAESAPDSVDIEVTKGWQSSVLLGGVDVVETRCMLVTNDAVAFYPLLAYTKFGSDDLRILRLNTEGTLITHTGSAVDDAFGGFDLEMVVGRPAIAYNRVGASGFGGLAYVRAADSLGTDWQQPEDLHLGGAAVATSGISLAVHNAVPTVAYAAYDAPLRYIRSVNTTGDIWHEHNDVLDEIEGFAHPVLLLAGTNSAIAAYAESGSAPTYIRASDPDGEVWETKQEAADFSYRGGLAARMVQGRPALVYSELSGIVFHRATNSSGTAWEEPQLLYDNPTNSAVRDINLELIAGVLTVVFYLPTPGDLYYIEALDDGGTQWGPLELVDGRHKAGECASLMTVQGRPAIFYGNADEELRIALLEF